ncbi:MAG: NUDIX hydrolase [Anaerolineae bacterium]|nr:NUDIX hydrolase [Anaerolineae bacterium]
MSGQRFWRGVATTVRRAPWIIGAARVVWRFRQAKFSAGVVGVVFNKAGEILIVEHVFHPYTPWGLPGGWVERHEDPAETIERELLEELEFKVRVGPLLLAKIDMGNHIDLAYLCYEEGTIGSLSNELLDHRWIHPDDLPHLRGFHDQAIQCALEYRLNGLS